VGEDWRCRRARQERDPHQRGASARRGSGCAGHISDRRCSASRLRRAEFRPLSYRARTDVRGFNQSKFWTRCSGCFGQAECSRSSNSTMRR
jgi:hypothetical protein